MNHHDQHLKFPEGTIVIAVNGERLGTIRTVYPHYLLVGQDDNPHTDLTVPPHAIASYDGDRLRLTVNRDALSVVDDQESAVRRMPMEES